jgi:hypothetical protein
MRSIYLPPRFKKRCFNNVPALRQQTTISIQFNKCIEADSSAVDTRRQTNRSSRFTIFALPRGRSIRLSGQVPADHWVDEMRGARPEGKREKST